MHKDRDNNFITIFDTTLRDGEQSPGASMSLSEKLQVAEVLDEMGVDVIEAGFPIASPGDYEAVSKVAEALKNSTVCGLARANEKDIDVARDALSKAKNFRIHTFISTSPVHMKHKLQLEAETVHDLVKFSVKRARNYTDDVEWSPEDATRTEHDFLCRCIESAIDAGATTINIPDTVGYSIPEEFYELVKMLIERIPNSDKAVFSTHCHNDLGMAVANSLAGVRAGARQIECTINGLGERAGNAAMEEVVMAFKTREDQLPYITNINSQLITRASKLVSAVTAFPVQFNKAIVGKNAFSHESGIHQDGVLKNVQTYEIMTPESVGLNQSSLVMGKHSGRHAFKAKLSELGFELDNVALNEAFKRFKELADKKKQVFDEDIEALIDDEIAGLHDKIKLEALTVIAGTGTKQKATITLDVDGTHVTKEMVGEGPVDAIFNAIRQAFPHDARLALYRVEAITEGTDAQAEVSVMLEHDGHSFIARAADIDTMVASARAYVYTLNKLQNRIESGIPIAEPQKGGIGFSE